ncbi:MAG: hypothetical protein IJN42_03660 [Clostridia bacterium]|nr:hypothetical protein [Clostridia bacterium]
MKKRLIALLLVVCLLLTGCELTETFTEDLLTEEKEEKITTLSDLSVVYYPGTGVHPLMDTSLANQKVHANVFLPAVTYNERLEPTYGVASEVTQEGDRITITPNTARKFSDGSAVTASDIAASFRYVLNNIDSPYYRRLAKVESVSVSGGKAVLNLKDADPGALYCMDIPIVKQAGTEKNPEYYGAGDYMFSDYNDVPVLLANPHSATPPVVTPVYLLTPDSDEGLDAMFNSGVLKILPSDLIAQGTFSASREYKTVSHLTNTMIFVGANNEKVPAAARRALSALIPRADIVDNVLMGLGQSATLPFYPGWSQVPAPGVQAPKDRLIELFTAAGFEAKNGELIAKEGDKPGYELLVCKDNKEHLAVAGKIRSAALVLGLEITVNEVERSTFEYRLENGNFELYVARYTLNHNLSCSELFLGEEAPNYCGVPSAALTNAYNTYMNGGKPADYLKILEQECPILPVAFLKNAVYHTRGISPTGGLSESQPLGELSQWTVE